MISVLMKYPVLEAGLRGSSRLKQTAPRPPRGLTQPAPKVSVKATRTFETKT